MEVPTARDTTYSTRHGLEHETRPTARMPRVSKKKKLVKFFSGEVTRLIERAIVEEVAEALHRRR